MKLLATLALSVALCGLVTPVATAQPPGTPPRQAASVDHVTMLTDRRAAVFVHSPSMGRVIQVQVLLPAGSAPRPTLYMLDGAGGGEESDYRESTWTQKTDAVGFFADKDVNVVLPVGGTGSYYTNWKRPDPALGVDEWETFLTEELPPLIDARFHGNGVNAIAGLSMGAHAALNLATRHPAMYGGVAAFSGCADNGQSHSKLSVRATVAWKGGDADNMWGPDGDPDWAANDPMRNAEALRGKEIYVAVGNGVVGPLDNPTTVEGLSAITLGAALESAALHCTQLFDQRLRQLGVPATFHYRPNGTHSWPYWQQDLHDAWPTLARALGR
ncbi:alpha/beta hydrolase [Rhodococcus sp. NPDC127528]|uniref:alpha/beta hydrolase n=1 Tax=unclassified Rhodococcus (in: high G+C Gram-positive bacteria) TaxID=192944 RepID=UPI00362CF47F